MTKGSAPYRFVPINREVVEPPVAFAALDLSKPLPGGSVSGTIKVTWKATTPVCVGEQFDAIARDGNASTLTPPVTPIEIAGQYCLPGPSLRGMIRSVLEIATHSHLGRINHWRRYSVRNFLSEALPDDFRPQPNDRGNYPPIQPCASWLTRDRNADGICSWFLIPCDRSNIPFGYWMLPLTVLQDHTDIEPNKWRKKTLKEKREVLADKKLLEPVGEDQNFFDGGTYYRNLRKVASSGLEGLTGQSIVVAGKIEEGNKANEYLFEPSDDSAKIPVPQHVMAKFHALHSNPGRTKESQEAVRNWQYWLEQLKAGNETKIPVFWVCTDHSKKNAKEEEATIRPYSPFFFISLSRVFRLPWRYSVGEVAQNAYENGNSPKRYRVPRLPPRDGTDEDAINGWDFSRALFGWVEDDKHDGWQKPEGGKTRALAGRVAVGFAWSPQGTNPERSAATGVLGTPRESFYPYYLTRKDAGQGKPNGASYDDDFAIPAGRKRYVVRETGKTVADIQREMPQPPVGQDGQTNDAVTSKIHFLPVGTAFTGDIRFHNLHPVELGALLWALTFGEPETAKRQERHQIGRAKPQGAGALLADVSLTAVTCHSCPPAEPGNANNLSNLTDENQRQVATYLKRFEDYMSGKGHSLADSPSVKALLKIANTRVGAKAHRNGKLEMTPLDKGPPERTYPGIKKSFDSVRLQRPNAARNQLPELPEPDPETGNGGSA